MTIKDSRPLLPSPGYAAAVERLKALRSTQESDPILADLVTARDEVLLRYGRMFARERLDTLTEADFRDFLMFRNNRHWSGLQRMGPDIVCDMDGLRSALRDLLDQNKTAAQRVDAVLPDGRTRVKRLGKAILTPILLISEPDRFAVWNGTSEGAMRELDVWPDLRDARTIGERYERINDLLLRFARDVGADLWTLDALWWRVLKFDENGTATDGGGDLTDEDETSPVRFGMERHLHDFLFDNWEQTDLGREWNLVEEGGDVNGYGYERPTPVGKIDLLARHKTKPRWLVIELKRSQSSDDTLGQLQRYMGWVKANLAGDAEPVEGLIIAQKQSEKLRYALMVTHDIQFMRYEVTFRLRKPNV